MGKTLRKTVVVLLIFIILACALAILSGATFYRQEIEVYYLTQSKTIQKKYMIATRHNLNAQLFYGGDMASYYKKTGLPPLEFLAALNPAFKADITDMYNSFYVQSTDASADFKNGKFTYYPETVGVSMDINFLCINIIKNFDKKVTVGLHLVYTEPKIKIVDLMRATEKVAEFSTSYHDSAEARKHNIALAAASLNGTIIRPGDTLSFNRIVGERTEEAGFKSAKIIVYGEYVEGTGGGVCQVSTTLYNAWLRAGLAVEKSYAHSLPSAYVPLGFDAMVSSRSDLVLKNDSKACVYVHAIANGSKLTFAIFGIKSSNFITLNSTVLREANETQGAYVQTYRTVTKDGVTKTEPLRKSAYQIPKKTEIVPEEL